MSWGILYASQLIAKVSTGLFSGAALYCSVAEHPGRMKAGVKVAASQFVPSFNRAAIFQSTVSLLGAVSSIVSHYYEPDNKWLAASLLLLSILPYTMVAIMPINRKLLDPERDRESKETKELLEKWGNLHALRTLVGFIAFVLLQL